METTTILLIATWIAGFYIAWNIGANDTANSMSSTVGAKALTLKQAIMIDSIFNLIGAAFVGSHVTHTISKGIVDPCLMGSTQNAIIAFFSAAVAAGIWVTIATWKELPVSTTHSIVGAIIGVGILSGGISAIHWTKVWGVVASWVISPVFASILGFSMMMIVNKTILQKENSVLFAKRYSPYFIGLTSFIIFSSLLFKTPLGKKLNISEASGFLIALITAIFSGCIGYNFFIKKRNIQNVEQIFRVLQIITSCYIGFAVGANDVANAVGPVASVRSIFITGEIMSKVTVPFYLLVFGGIGILIGTLTWGYKVISTVGFKITDLTNSRGFSIDFGAATSVLVASKLGFPVSTTHAVVGAVIGVGLARGLEAINLGVIKNIVLSWLITLPVTAAISALIFTILR